jgi:hypothetical protein
MIGLKIFVGNLAFEVFVERETEVDAITFGGELKTFRKDEIVTVFD